MKQETPGGLCGRTIAARRTGGRRAAAFTILELEVSLVILVAGLFTTVGLLSAQGRQMSHVESWCRPAPTYYLVNHSNRWMRRLDAAAEVHTEAGQPAWTPPVSGQQVYNLFPITENVDYDGQVIEVRVWLWPAGG